MKKFDIGKWLKWLPLLAPLPEGYAVYLAIERELGWTPVFVFISGAVVALTGFYGVYVRTHMSEFNATLRKDEVKEIGKVQTWKADGILAVWFAGVVMITVFLDTLPVLRTMTPVALVVIGFGSNYLYALSNILQEHVQARDEHRVTKRQKRDHARNEQKAARNERKQKAQRLATIKQAISEKFHFVQGGKGIKHHTKSGSKLSDEVLLLEWAGSPYLTPTEMAEVLWDEGKGIKVSRQAISQRRDAMVKRGLIVVESDGRIVQPIMPEAEVSVG